MPEVVLKIQHCQSDTEKI